MEPILIGLAITVALIAAALAVHINRRRDEEALSRALRDPERWPENASEDEKARAEHEGRRRRREQGGDWQ